MIHVDHAGARPEREIQFLQAAEGVPDRRMDQEDPGLVGSARGVGEVGVPDLSHVRVEAGFGKAGRTAGVVDPGCVPRRGRVGLEELGLADADVRQGRSACDGGRPPDHLTNRWGLGQRLLQRSDVLTRRDDHAGHAVVEHVGQLARRLQHRRRHRHGAEAPHGQLDDPGLRDERHAEEDTVTRTDAQVVEPGHGLRDPPQHVTVCQTLPLRALDTRDRGTVRAEARDRVVEERLGRVHAVTRPGIAELLRAEGEHRQMPRLPEEARCDVVEHARPHAAVTPHSKADCTGCSSVGSAVHPSARPEFLYWLINDDPGRPSATEPDREFSLPSRVLPVWSATLPPRAPRAD